MDCFAGKINYVFQNNFLKCQGALNPYAPLLRYRDCRQKETGLYMLHVTFFDKSKDPIQNHGNDTQDDDGH